MATFAFVTLDFATLDDLLSPPPTLDDLLSAPVSSTLDDLLSSPLSSTLDDLLSTPSSDSVPIFDFFVDFAPPPPLDDLEECTRSSSTILSPKCPDSSFTALEVMDKHEEEGRTRIFDVFEVEEDGTYKEDEILRIFDDFALFVDETEEREYEEMALLALALEFGGSLKTRYGFVAEAEAVVTVTVAITVASRRDAMPKFMMVV